MPTPTRSRRRRGALVAFFVAVSAAFVVADPQQPASPPRPSQAPAQFKAGTDLVTGDAYPTQDGQPVEDLTAADFADHGRRHPAEDRDVEHIVVQPASQGERVDPASPTRANQLAADPHRRVFVVFLDTGGVHVEGSYGIKEPLIALLTQILGPDDLVGVMLPHMSPDQIAFGRKTEVIKDQGHAVAPFLRRRAKSATVSRSCPTCETSGRLRV